MKCDRVAVNLRAGMGKDCFAEKICRAYNAKIRTKVAISRDFRNVFLHRTCDKALKLSGKQRIIMR